MTQKNLMASPPPFDRTRMMKMSGLANYHNPFFETTNNVMPPALFNSDGRISSWPWFCMNDVNASSAETSTEANLPYNKSSERKEDVKNNANSNSIESNQQNSLSSCSSKIENDGVKNCNVSNSTKNSETYEKGAEKISFLPCSPNGNVSSMSSPILDDNEIPNVNLNSSSSPTGSHVQIKQSQVI